MLITALYPIEPLRAPPPHPAPQPRCPGCIDTSSQGTVQGWINDMASHLKANAPNQLVAAGTEGYFLNAYEEWNPGGSREGRPERVVGPCEDGIWGVGETGDLAVVPRSILHAPLASAGCRIVERPYQHVPSWRRHGTCPHSPPQTPCPALPAFPRCPAAAAAAAAVV